MYLYIMYLLVIYVYLSIITIYLSTHILCCHSSPYHLMLFIWFPSVFQRKFSFYKRSILFNSHGGEVYRTELTDMELLYLPGLAYNVGLQLGFWVLGTWTISCLLQTLWCVLNTCVPVFFLLSGILESWHVLVRRCLHNQFPINSLGSESLITYILLHFHCRGRVFSVWALKEGREHKKPCAWIPPDTPYVYFTVVGPVAYPYSATAISNESQVYTLSFVSLLAIIQIGGVSLRDPWHRKPENFSSQQFIYSLTILPDEVPGPSESKSTISVS